MKTPFPLLLLATLLRPALGAPQLVPPPTVTCRQGCEEMVFNGTASIIKWCHRCTQHPVTCSLWYSLPCAADTSDPCVVGIADAEECAARDGAGGGKEGAGTGGG